MTFDVGAGQPAFVPMRFFLRLLSGESMIQGGKTFLCPSEGPIESKNKNGNIILEDPIRLFVPVHRAF